MGLYSTTRHPDVLASPGRFFSRIAFMAYCVSAFVNIGGKAGSYNPENKKLPNGYYH